MSVSSNGNNVVLVTALTLGSTAKFDLSNNTLIVDYTGSSPASALLSELNDGRNGGTWNGTTGIVSTTAATNASSTIGFAEASSVLSATGGLVAGQTVDGTALLMRYTFAGDANLDRSVNFEDLLLLAKNYGQSGSQFSQGDFDYSGTVDFNDLLSLAKNYGQLVSGLSANVEGRTLAQSAPRRRRGIDEVM